MTGNGNMLNDETAPPSHHRPDYTYPDAETRPRLPITVRGGFPNGFNDGVLLSECELLPVIHALPAYDFTMIVTGNSMEPNYCGGDEIAIRKVIEYIEWGSVYVLDTADGAILKRIYDEGEYFRCVSFNDEYAPFTVRKSTVHGIYKVVGLIRIYSANFQQITNKMYNTLKYSTLQSAVIPSRNKTI